MDNSRKTFILDQIIRQTALKDCLYNLSALGTISGDDFELVLKDNPGSEKLFAKVYDAYIDYITENITVTAGDREYKPEKVEYHPKNGWELDSEAGPVYMGKFEYTGKPTVSIGRRSYISGDTFFRGVHHLIIGSFCSIAKGGDFITSNISHPISFPSTFCMGRTRRKTYEWGENYYDYITPKNGTTIGNDVYIGENVTIMNGIRIGDGCVLAKNALVTKDCIPYGVYGGTPAKLIKTRFSDRVISQLLELQWWKWSDEKINRNRKFFLTDLKEWKDDLMDLLIED